MSAASGSQRDAAELVHHLLAQLSPRDRLVITLIHLESHSYEEAGRLTGWGTRRWSKSRRIAPANAWRRSAWKGGLSYEP